MMVTTLEYAKKWPGGVMVMALGLRLNAPLGSTEGGVGRGFDSRPFRFQIGTLEKLVMFSHSHMCLCHQTV